MAEFTDEQIEAFVQKHGAKWDGNHWTIEDADLHPLIRAALSAPQEAGKAETQKDWIRSMNLEADIRRVIGWEKPINDFDVVKELQEYIALLAASKEAGKVEAVADEARWRPEVVAFADSMEEKLRANDWKGGWKDDASGALMTRVHEEMREFVSAHVAYPRDTDAYRANLRAEGADVANMIMMVLDVCGALPIRPTVADEPVAWRYTNARGHYRYVGNRPDRAYDSLLKPIPLYLRPSQQALSDAKDAARYRWLRHGDNDERVLMTYDQQDGVRTFDHRFDNCWLPRNEKLDEAIDSAILAAAGGSQ